METNQMSFGKLAPLFLTMSVLFGFAQAMGLISRIVFRINLSPEQYGIFAFFINLFPVFVTLNELSLSVPIISIISGNPSDDTLYDSLLSQIFSTSLISGIIIASFFLILTVLETAEYIIALYFAVMVILYSTSQVLHSFPRGQNRFRPAITSLIIVGTGRIVLLALFLVLEAKSLFFIAVAYTLPLLGWWTSYVYNEGIPSVTRPKLEDVVPIYKNAIISYMYPLGLNIPIILSVLVLTRFYGFTSVGDFDIALIPYSGLAVLFTGIEFVTISKARQFPSFRDTMKQMLRTAIVPLFAMSFLLTVFAPFIERYAKVILQELGLPVSVYWPAIILVAFGVPTAVLLSMIVTYFQGRGTIRPVGLIVILCAIGSIPIQAFLIFIYSVNGAASAVVLLNFLMVGSLVVYGYRHQEGSNHEDNSLT